MDEAHDQTKRKRVKSARVRLGETIAKEQRGHGEGQSHESQILVTAIVGNCVKRQERRAKAGQEIGHAFS